MSTILEELTKYREILSEGKCKFCHKPVELVPSAAERARKNGGSPSDYIALFPNHAECEIENRKKGDSEAAAKRRERDEANGPVILKRTMKEATLLKWRVSPVATGRYRSFEKRYWPSAQYQDGSPAVQLLCAEQYSPRAAAAENLEIKIGVADHSDPSNKETGAGFTWKYLKQRANSLAQAKVLAQSFLQNNPKFAPKPEAAPETVVEEGLHNPPDQIGRLLDILNGYAEKMNRLAMLGKTNKRFQLAMDKVEETILGYPDGQTRLNDFWAQYNQSFDEGCQLNSENIVTEYQNPAELPAVRPDSSILLLGKQNAMEELGDIVARIPANQNIPYEEFHKIIQSLHRTFKLGSRDEKVFYFTRGWNSILYKVNELVPKSREKHMTKDELETVLSLVGQKELNWN